MIDIMLTLSTVRPPSVRVVVVVVVVVFLIQASIYGMYRNNTREHYGGSDLPQNTNLDANASIKCFSILEEFEEYKSIRICRSAYRNCWQFKSSTLHWLVDSNRLACFKFLWPRILHRSCWESYFWDLRIALLGKFRKDKALIRRKHKNTSSR